MSDAVIPYPVSGCTPYIVGPMGQPGVYDYVIIHGESLKDHSYGNYSPNTNYNAAIYVHSIGYIITYDPGGQWDDIDSCGLTLRVRFMISMEHAILLQLDMPLMLDIVFRIPTAYLFYTKKFLTFALRTSATTTSTMHASFTRLVSSSTATMCIGIPTGGALRSRIGTVLLFASSRPVASTIISSTTSTAVPTGVYHFLTK